MKKKEDRISRILGASVRLPAGLSGHAPWDMYHLLDTLKARLKPGKGMGRPTEEEWTVRRLVGFRARTWKRLQRLAEKSAKQGEPRLSPAQIAAFLIEQTLEKSKVG